MPRFAGFEQALQMLSGLDYDTAEKLLVQIAAKDPSMAEKLRHKLITIEDLQYVSPQMLVELFREVKLEDMALALRLGSAELRAHILQHVSSGMAKEISQVLDGEAQPRNVVNEANERVMQVVRKKVANKELIIDKTGEETV